MPVLMVCQLAEVLDGCLENSFRELPATAMDPHRELEPQEVQGAPGTTVNSIQRERSLKC